MAGPQAWPAIAFTGSDFERLLRSLVSPFIMKTAALALFAATVLFVVSPVFAGNKGDHACCAKSASHSKDVACINYASLNLTSDQKAKIEKWQGECLKAGCTDESRRTFLDHSKSILSADQFAKLKQQCNASAASKTRA